MKTRILTALATGVAILATAGPSVADPWSPPIPLGPEHELPLRPEAEVAGGPVVEVEPVPFPRAEPEPVPEAPARRGRASWEEFGVGAVLGLGAGLLLGSGMGAPHHGTPAAPDPHRAADWHAYCAARYPHYDPATGTWLGRDGRRYACR